jgi:pimeloyl-ACP methyl ester carboxylesterase
VVLVHGWGSSFAATWESTGFTALLADGGKQVVGVDLLGHGDAPKPHDPEAYADLSARIVEAVAPDAVGPAPVAGIGFSLGAMSLLRAALVAPERFERIVLAGIGDRLFDPDPTGAQEIAAGLRHVEAGGDPGELSQQVRVFVNYAQRPGNDPVALAAVMERPAAKVLTPTDLAAISCPVLVVIGDRDFAGPATELAAAFPAGRLVQLPNTDHFATPEAFGFFDAALEFVGAV